MMPAKSSEAWLTFVSRISRWKPPMMLAFLWLRMARASTIHNNGHKSWVLEFVRDL